MKPTLKQKSLYAAATAVVMISTAVWLNRTVPVDEIAPTDQFDSHFRKYNKRYFSVLSDWRWFKAQSMVESSLRRDVESDQGAVGVMQVLPDTFDEVLDPYFDLYSITDPAWNIATGIAFNRYLYDRWRERLPPEESLKFALASYNAGFSRMLRVRKRAAAKGQDAANWSDVAPYAPGETRLYVERVHDLMGYEY